MKTLIPVLALVAVVSCSSKHTVAEGQAAASAGNYAKAVSIWRPLAEAGNADAMFWIGDAYTYGHGVKQDDAEALKWAKKAADGGMPFYQYSYAMRGMRCGDPVESSEYLRRAAEQGHRYAMDWLWQSYAFGKGVPVDVEEAYFWALQVKSYGGPVAPYMMEYMEQTLGPAKVHQCQRRATEHWKKIQEHPAQVVQL